MHYEKYEKLIVVDKGVEIVNWPMDIPFVNASGIGSFHSLMRLFTALTLQDMEKRCRWVTLSEAEWEQRKNAYIESQAQVEPKKRKRGVAKSVTVENESRSSPGARESDEEEEPRLKKKRGRKGKTSGKENDEVGTSSGKGKGKGKGKANGGNRGKRLANSLALSDGN